MSDSVSPTLTNVEEIFKSLVWDSVIKGWLTALYASSPIAAFFKPAIDLAVKMIGDLFFSKIRLVVDIGAIKLLDEQANAAYRKASVTLAVIAHDKGIDSNEFKNARENAKQALSDFVRFRG